MNLPPVFATRGKLFRRLDPNNLTHMVIAKNYVYVYHVNENTPYQVRCTLEAAVASLRPLFVHVSRSTAVSLLHIDRIDRTHLMIGKEKINIARTYYRHLINNLGIIGWNGEREDEEMEQD